MSLRKSQMTLPPLLKTINAVLAKSKKQGIRKKIHYFMVKDPKFARFYFFA